jgi:hypothetical protein
MTIQQLRNAYESKPFRPFAIKLADGAQFRVRSPEFLAISPGGRTVIVVTGDDDFQVVDLLLVTALEFGNGKAKPPRDR